MNEKEFIQIIKEHSDRHKNSKMNVKKYNLKAIIVKIKMQKKSKIVYLKS